jgi:hypothetical protein
MTKAEQYLTDRNITPTLEIIAALDYFMRLGYSTSVMGMSATTLDDLHNQWFSEEDKKKSN